MHRPLLLGGFMRVGKSTVGPRVAERAGVPFVDLDAGIVEAAGRSIREIFEADGEGAFRALERDRLEAELSDPTPRVIALGGGALLTRELRLRALERAVVITLEAPLAVLRARAPGDATRPLFDERAAQLLEQRAVVYAEAHARVDATRSVAQVADDVLDVWQRDPVCVAAGLSSYAVDVDVDIAVDRAAAAMQTSTGVLVVSDVNVAPLHAAPILAALTAAGHSLQSVVLPAGEEHKTIAGAERVWRAAHDMGLDRKGRMLALGGGVVSDIAGFAASTWLRGVSWAGLPSTLLAMVDASVGGKTAVDFGIAKNAVGAFWQPTGVACDVALLQTEPERGYRSALSEVVKTALIGDPALLTLLETRRDAILARDPATLVELVRRCVVVKAGVVSRDEREAGLRATLNLGHTFGHALEAYTGYRRYTHGEAISLGLMVALGMGERLGATPASLSLRIREVLAAFGLPVDRGTAPLVDAADLAVHDKKRAGTTLRLVLAHDVGDVRTRDVPVADVIDLARSLL
ncbi:MAG: 3-dehydroquinate synthase [Polyangiaceae bacterium]|nr:3-dehydroquinate synthase [Polyangiaceae bacterium]